MILQHVDWKEKYFCQVNNGCYNYFIILQFIYSGVPYLNNDQVNWNTTKRLTIVNSLAMMAKSVTYSYNVHLTMKKFTIFIHNKPDNF